MCAPRVPQLIHGFYAHAARRGEALPFQEAMLPLAFATSSSLIGTQAVVQVDDLPISPHISACSRLISTCSRLFTLVHAGSRLFTSLTPLTLSPAFCVEHSYTGQALRRAIQAHGRGVCGGGVDQLVRCLTPIAADTQHFHLRQQPPLPRGAAIQHGFVEPIACTCVYVRVCACVRVQVAVRDDHDLGRRWYYMGDATQQGARHIRPAVHHPSAAGGQSHRISPISPKLTELAVAHGISMHLTESPCVSPSLHASPMSFTSACLHVSSRWPSASERISCVSVPCLL